jgi:hypothetical protein
MSSNKSTPCGMIFLGNKNLNTSHNMRNCGCSSLSILTPLLPGSSFHRRNPKRDHICVKKEEIGTIRVREYDGRNKLSSTDIKDSVIFYLC